MSNESKDLIKPVIFGESKPSKKLTMEEALAMVKSMNGDGPDHPVEKPFTTKFDSDAKPRMYLILWERCGDHCETERDWQFFNGFTQALYNYLRDEIVNGEKERYPVDVMKSKLLVDSPNIPLSKNISVYLFMRDMLVKNKVKEDTSFDIENYYYNEEDDLNGKKE